MTAESVQPQSSQALAEAELRARPGIKWHRYGDDVLPAWIAEMDFDVPSQVHAALGRLVDEGAYGYEDPNLYPELAAAFAQHMQSTFGWQPDPDLTLPVADLVQAQFASVAAFTDPGEGVILQTPIYPPFINAVVEQGRRVVEHRLIEGSTRYVLDSARLASLVDHDTPLMLLCNPHNPTGRVFELPELESIAAIALERNLVVVSDEVHAELAYPGHTHVPFATLGREIAELTVTITSATKAYNIPGLRCGVMHFGSHALRERFRARLPDRALGKVNQFGVVATIVAWRQCVSWLAGVMPLLQSNRESVTRFLQRELPSIGYHAPEASYLAWLDCRRLPLQSTPYEFFLERARVAMNDGDEFGPTGKGHVRLNFATSDAILRQILNRLADAVRSVSGT